MEISESMAVSTYYILKNIEDKGYKLGGMVQDWEELLEDILSKQKVVKP